MRDQWIVVLGMHRSGTSALSGELHHQGVNFGNHFIEDIESVNKKGFYEHSELVAINESILHYFGLTWFDCFKLNEIYTSGKSLPPEIKQRMVDFFFLDDFKESSINGMKDPRLCILLPFWLDVINELEINVKFILLNREPENIILSLYKRDKMSKLLSELLWEYYLISSIYYTTNHKRFFVDFSLFMSRPIDTINKIFNALDIHIKAESYYFVDPKIPRNKNKQQNNKLYSKVSLVTEPLNDIDWASEYFCLLDYFKSNEKFIFDITNSFYIVNDLYKKCIENGNNYSNAIEVIKNKDEVIKNKDESIKKISSELELVKKDLLDKVNRTKCLKAELDKSFLHYLVRLVKKITG